MKLAASIFLAFIIICLSTASVLAFGTGVQLPNEKPLNRLLSSGFRYEWVKYQLRLNEPRDQEIAAVKSWAEAAKRSSPSFKVMVSVVKKDANAFDLCRPKPNPPGNRPQPPEGIEGDPVYEQAYIEYIDHLTQYLREEEEYLRKLAEWEQLWPTAYNSFKDDVKNIVSTLGSNIDAIEIWNEPNLHEEWVDTDPNTPGNDLAWCDSNQEYKVDPIKYAGLLAAGAQGAKEAKPSIKVISAAMATNTNGRGNEDNFYVELFKQSWAFSKVDYIGVHLNINTDITPSDGRSGGFFERASRYLALASGIDKRLWITEFGWDSDNLPGTPPQRKLLQARYVAEAIDKIQSDPTLGQGDNAEKGNHKFEGMAVFNYGFTLDANGHFDEWDIEGQNLSELSKESCQTNYKNSNIIYPDNSSVQAPTLDDDYLITKTFGQSQLPQEIFLSIYPTPPPSGPVVTPTITKLRADVKHQFAVDAIVGIFEFLKIKGSPCSLNFGPINISFCSPTVTIGHTERPVNGEAPGKNTETFSAAANILTDSFVPSNLSPTPKLSDNNIGKFNEAGNSQGQAKINSLNTSLGVEPGLYTNNLPGVEEDRQTTLQRQLNRNLALNKKLFVCDERVTGIDKSQGDFYQSNYPDELKPLFKPVGSELAP